MSDEEKNKLVKIKDKALKEKSFIMDINMIEAPLFQFKNKRSIQTVRSLEKDPTISNEIKYVLSRMPEESKSSQVEFLSWTDGNGLEREILATSIFRLPNAFAMDVFHALIGLYIKKNSPIAYLEDEKIYNMPENKLEFRILEVCDYMKISYGGTIYQKIKDAIRELSSVKYYSLANGTFYNKGKEQYETSREKSISLIGDYDIIQKGKSKSDEMCQVTFGNLVMENIKYSYIKFLNDNTYFKLKSGLTRRLYTYIEGNKYNKKYIKRSFDVLRYKIPIDFKYSSDLKKRLKSPMENLMSSGVIKDYFYGNDILINGEKEDCIYIIFNGDRKEIIDSLTTEPVIVEKEEEIQAEFEFPNDIESELIKLDIDKSKISEIMEKNTKWQIAEYILWIKDGMKKGKVKNAATLFVFAALGGMVNVSATNPEISEFVENVKKEAEGKTRIKEEVIKQAYNEYIEKEIRLFASDDEFVFSALKSTVIGDIEKAKSKRIKSLRQRYNIEEKESEKELLLKRIERWEKFSIEKEKSEIFIEQLVKSAKAYRGLLDYDEFKNEYLEKNS